MSETKEGCQFFGGFGQRLLSTPRILSQFSCMGFPVDIDALQHGVLLMLSLEQKGRTRTCENNGASVI